jgi:hypothetical protein
MSRAKIPIKCDDGTTALVEPLVAEYLQRQAKQPPPAPPARRQRKRGPVRTMPLPPIPEPTPKTASVATAEEVAAQVLAAPIRAFDGMRAAAIHNGFRLTPQRADTLASEYDATDEPIAMDAAGEEV